MIFIAEALLKRTSIMGIHIHFLHPVHEVGVPQSLFQLLLGNNI